MFRGSWGADDIAAVLPRIESWADAEHRYPSREWTAAVRSSLWRCYRERWRDDRVKLEDAQRRLERRGRTVKTHDLGSAMRQLGEALSRRG